MTGAMYTCRMTLLTLQTLILWISFANTSMRYVRLQKQSTLLHNYPSKRNSNPLIIQACFHHSCIPGRQK
ncbi:Bgt-20285 [Blumeria graminis f. sp. tritici]|uniref:Bgt-20285 n=2 Tax=Blumeria graminis f. sp. tritici TaxID=62690 RepID=A0A9X9MKZ1_BLUGR|nr:Bgt-20285 [Blumeria graminis f. sp. tritici]